MKIKTKDWNKILLCYEGLRDNHNWHIEPMIELVSFIVSRKYSNGIHGYTSHATLCVGQYLELGENNALLKIEYIKPSGKWNIAKICKDTGLHRNTVSNYLKKRNDDDS